MDKQVVEQDDIYSISIETVEKTVEFIEKGKLKEAKQLLNQYKIFMQSMIVLELLINN